MIAQRIAIMVSPTFLECLETNGQKEKEGQEVDLSKKKCLLD